MRQYKSKPVESQTFELDGVEFTVPGNLFMLDLVELAKLSDVDTMDPRAIKAVTDLFENLLGDDFNRFHAHCREHKTSNETLMEIMQDLIGDTMGGFPTQQASPSAPGTTTTGPTYTVVSPSSGSVVQFPMTPERETELRQAVESARAQWESKTG